LHGAPQTIEVTEDLRNRRAICCVCIGAGAFHIYIFCRYNDHYIFDGERTNGFRSRCHRLKWLEPSSIWFEISSRWWAGQRIRTKPAGLYLPRAGSARLAQGHWTL